MALHYDYSACADESKVIDHVSETGDGGWKIDPNGKYKQLKPFAESMVFAFMVCGINGITAKNVDEVFIRLNMYETCRGAMRNTKEGPVYFTLAEVKTLIGIKTNVSDDTRAQFQNNLIRIIREESQRVLFHEKQKEQAA